MIKRFSGKQVITEEFGAPRSYGFHRGIDLRSRRFEKGKGFVEQWALQPILLDERCRVLRRGRDEFGNGYLVVEPLESKFSELKYIHVALKLDISVGQILQKGEKIGYTEHKGSSRAHHLHFEVWKDSNGKLIPIDPEIYLIAMGIKYKFKDAA